MSAAGGQPRSVADAVRAVRDSVQPQTLLAAVETVWPRAAGEEIAANASPVSERLGVITVACAAATWAQELDLLGPELTERLRSELGERLPADAELRLRFIVRDLLV